MQARKNSAPAGGVLPRSTPTSKTSSNVPTIRRPRLTLPPVGPWPNVRAGLAVSFRFALGPRPVPYCVGTPRYFPFFRRPRFAAFSVSSPSRTGSVAVASCVPTVGAAMADGAVADVVVDVLDLVLVAERFLGPRTRTWMFTRSVPEAPAASVTLAVIL